MANAASAGFRSEDRQVRVVLLPWMVAGVRTQYENLRCAETPANFLIDTVPIAPYKSGGVIERLPLLPSSVKGTLRSAAHVRHILDRPHDAVWAQTLLPLIPLLVIDKLKAQAQVPIVYTIDTTPRLMDGFSEAYYGVPPAAAAKRTVRDALHRYALQRCAAVVPWSHWAARSFAQDYGVAEDRLHVIPPGVDLTAWTVSPHRLSGERPERRFRLLFVGADWERKGGPALLDVYRAGLQESCELHLVTKADLEEEPGIHVYRGFGPNEPGLRELYARSDALVLPTRADCFSMASLEAMACGLPVISSPVGGIVEIVDHGKNGLLVPPDDRRALLEAIQALLSEPARALAMGRAGRSIVEQRFDNRLSARAHFALLAQVAEAASRSSSASGRRSYS